MKNPNKVDLSKLRKEIRKALFACEIVYGMLDLEFEVWHTYDGSHRLGSLHFKNRAFDGGPLGPHIQDIAQSLRVFLGTEYDVVLEYDTTAPDGSAIPGCLHVEWDPK
jgi:hypothetical protein